MPLPSSYILFIVISSLSGIYVVFGIDFNKRTEEGAEKERTEKGLNDLFDKMETCSTPNARKCRKRAYVSVHDGIELSEHWSPRNYAAGTDFFVLNVVSGGPESRGGSRRA